MESGCLCLSCSCGYNSILMWRKPHLKGYLFFAHNGLKCTVRQILPPRYIFAVLPSSSGIWISGAVLGYVAGISNSKSNSYFSSSCTYQHLPDLHGQGSPAQRKHE